MTYNPEHEEVLNFLSKSSIVLMFPHEYVMDVCIYLYMYTSISFLKKEMENSIWASFEDYNPGRSSQL